LTLAPPLSTSSENALNMKYDTRVCGHRSDGCEMWREVVFLKALDWVQNEALKTGHVHSADSPH